MKHVTSFGCMDHRTSVILLAERTDRDDSRECNRSRFIQQCGNTRNRQHDGHISKKRTQQMTSLRPGLNTNYTNEGMRCRWRQRWGANRGGAAQLCVCVGGAKTGDEHKYTRGKRSKRHHKNSQDTQKNATAETLKWEDWDNVSCLVKDGQKHYSFFSSTLERKCLQKCVGVFLKRNSLFSHSISGPCTSAPVS